MFMFLRQLAAAPIRLIAWANSFLGIIDKRKLAQAIWFLTRQPDDAATLLILASQSQSIEATRAMAERLSAQTRSARIAALMACLEIRENPDCAAAVDWISKAESSDCTDTETLLNVKLQISCVRSDYDRAQVVQELLSRNDLPMGYTSAALLENAAMLLEEHKWAEAEAIADKVLYVEEHPFARVIKWLVCLARDDRTAAEKHQSIMKHKFPPPLYYYCLADGLLTLERKAEAMEALHQGLSAGLTADRLRGPLKQLHESGEFAAWCGERGQ